jgi:hypothetical protein
MNHRTWITGIGVVIAAACASDRIASPTTPTGGLALLFFQAPPPTSVPPGTTAAMAVVARFTDGSERTVTSDASWTSSQPQIATVSKGVITALTIGLTQIRANYQSRTVSSTVVVEPEGTFVVSGTITEPGGLKVQGATVTVIGSSTPNQLVSPSSGAYQFFGVSGTVTLVVSKAGYTDERRTLVVMQDQKVDVQITQIVPPLPVAGTYRMAITISPSCTIVPDDLKTRTYTATITQDTARLTIKLSDANLVTGKDSLTGTMFGGTITFNFGPGDSYYLFYYGSPIQEALPQAILGIWGTMVTPVGPQDISGSLVGGFTYGGSRSSPGCSSNGSKIVLTPKPIGQTRILP